MNILFAASEAAPFIKTGGLADVAGSLPAVLAAAGHDVRVVIPLYEQIGEDWRSQMTYLTNTRVRLAWRDQYCGLFELKRDGVTYYFIDNEYYFRRWDIYGHFDDGERFAFFSRAVIQLPAMVDWPVDILHCNDWQTALVPVYLLEEKYRIPQLGGARSVFTIHNIEYQGRYDKFVLKDVCGLDESYFNEHMLAYHDDVNLMQGAIFAADAVTTVSPTYAMELQDSFWAHGLEGVVRANSYKLQGILNGIDVERNSPKGNKAIAKSFYPTRMTGKAECKAALQQMVGLTPDPEVPVIACISRLVNHKGFDLVVQALGGIMDLNVQMVVLGTGEARYEEAFRAAQGLYPGRFSAQIMYSAPLSTAIYAGADLFLMPSISEPCGLSQMIAMRYGTVPVVRETGGLKDTVIPYNKYTGEGRGFTFSRTSPEDMLWVLREAVELYRTDKKAWKALQKAGMTADFSWGASAERYLELYRQLLG